MGAKGKGERKEKGRKEKEKGARSAPDGVGRREKGVGGARRAWGAAERVKRLQKPSEIAHTVGISFHRAPKALENF